MTRRVRRRELLVLRHAKSSWTSDAPTDFERPLTKRGKRDCGRIAAWMSEQHLEPDAILASPALRARQTARRVRKALGVAGAAVRLDERLYLASYRAMLAELATVDPDTRRVLLVGHNPGLDDLVLHLAAGAPGRAASGKLMTTAALAWFDLPADWSDLADGCGRLRALVRPKELTR